MEDAFIGVEENLVCNLIFLAKMFIYNKRIHDEQYTFRGFLGYLQKFMMIEHNIAKKNNTLDDWLEKWSFFLSNRNT